MILKIYLGSVIVTTTLNMIKVTALSKKHEKKGYKSAEKTSFIEHLSNIISIVLIHCIPLYNLVLTGFLYFSDISEEIVEKVIKKSIREQKIKYDPQFDERIDLNKYDNLDSANLLKLEDGSKKYYFTKEESEDIEIVKLEGKIQFNTKEEIEYIASDFIKNINEKIKENFGSKESFEEYAKNNPTFNLNNNRTNVREDTEPKYNYNYRKGSYISIPENNLKEAFFKNKNTRIKR